MEKKVLDQGQMREANLMEVLEIIRTSGPVTRRELQELAGLSWGGTSQIVSRLLNQGYVVEEKTGGGIQTDSSAAPQTNTDRKKDASAGKGRTPSRLKINEEKNLVLGVDINESGITAVAMSLGGQVKKHETGTADYTTRETLFHSIFQVLDKVYEDCREKGIFAVGVSMQGIVDAEKGISVLLEGCADWENVPVCRILEARYQAPVFAAHDPDCLVASNVSCFGENVMLLRSDYGIGMSVYRNGTFFTGPGLLEIGHTLAVPSGKTEEPIKTLAYYATIPEIERRAGCTVQELRRRGLAEPYFDEAAECLGTALINAVVMFNIHTILLSGKLMEYGELFFEKLKKRVQNYFPYEIRIFTYDAGQAAYGAALLATQRRMKV